MADNTGHGDRARAPRVPKIEVKQIVLDKLVSPYRDLRYSQQTHAYEELSPAPIRLTVCMEPPDRCWATAFAMAGFSATHRILDMTETVNQLVSISNLFMKMLC